MTKYIELKGIRGKGKRMQVDDQDYKYLSKFSWYLGYRKGTPYSYAYSSVSVQRLLLLPDKGLVVDHINGDALDNRRSNLRIATQRQNLQNRVVQKSAKCKYKGVSKNHNKFRVWIQAEYIGTYETAEEAAHVYDREAKKRYGEFARLNFPNEK